jgi:hypothetical protein
MWEHGVPDSKLIVIKKVGQYVSPSGLKEPLWLCECSCEKHTQLTLRGSQIRSGRTKSCGCFKTETTKNIMTKHGFGDKENLYRHWLNMRFRCNSPTYEKYDCYGGRGISVCPEWDDYAVFRAWAMDNGYAEGLTLERINVDGNYEPTNCKWATWKEQQNNKRSNHSLTYNGVTHTMKEWSEIRGINYGTLRGRINNYGWSIGRALEYE